MKLNTRLSILAAASVCSLFVTPVQVGAAPTVVDAGGSGGALHTRIIGTLVLVPKANGTVSVDNGTANTGADVHNGSLIVTHAYPAKITLRSGGYVLVKPNSRVRVYDDEDTPVRLDISEGGGWVVKLHNLPPDFGNDPHRDDYANVIREDSEVVGGSIIPLLPSTGAAGTGNPSPVFGGGGGTPTTSSTPTGGVVTR